MSTYDRIHDEFIPDDEIRKQGVKYERLVALVSAYLNGGPVVHDVRLRGDSSVKHQIDVHVGDRRILVECKDLDISHERVGLEIVRSFATVVRDVNPSDAWIVTCVGFTRDARTMAKSQGIKLVLLREFRDEDREGRIWGIGFEQTMKADYDHQITFVAGPSGDSELLAALRELGPRPGMLTGKTGVLLKTVDCEAAVDLTDWVHGKRPGFDPVRKADDAYSERFDLPGALITVGSLGTFEISGIVVSYVVRSVTARFEIDTAGKIATLLLHGVGEGDMVVWDTDLRRFDIDSETGEVRERSRE